MWVDLHMHSCLSPCAEDDMTPANICGMAYLKGLQAIAVTDHNTARNLPYVKEAADHYGLILLPGMEITTKEEVHLLGYFRDVDTAVEVGEIFSSHLPKMKNKPDFFGNQLVMNTDDEVVAVEDRLLIGATDLAGQENSGKGCGIRFALVLDGNGQRGYYYIRKILPDKAIAFG